MKFTLKSASGETEEKQIEISTLDELMDIVRENDSVIVTEFDGEKEIMIYDDHIE